MKHVSSLQEAIRATVVYFDLMDFPLNLAELEMYLYGWSAPQEAIKEEIAKMPFIKHKDGFYFLESRENLAQSRLARETVNKKLWARAKKYKWLIEACPFVRMAAVCNSLAYGNAREGSDIDLFIITKKGKLWTARFFLKILTQIFGMRVHHEKISGRFCLSFFISEKNMNLKNISHDFDPHLAYFVATMQPLFGKKYYLKFLEENWSWIFHYFKRKLPPRLTRLSSGIFAGIFRALFEIFLSIFGNLSEKLFYKMQLRKDEARKKTLADKSGIVMNKNIFKFHNSDPRKKIAEAFLEKF